MAASLDPKGIEQSKYTESTYKGSDDKGTADKGYQPQPREFALHIYFPGGHPATFTIYSSHTGKPGHLGIQATSIEDAIMNSVDIAKDVNGHIIGLEIIAHGTAWRKNNSGEIVIDPPGLQCQDRPIQAAYLDAVTESTVFQRPFQFVRQFTISACNMGHGSDQYVHYRERLAQLFFGGSDAIVAGACEIVRVVSCRAYIDIHGWPSSSGSSPDSQSCPNYAQDRRKIVIEAYKKDTRRLSLVEFVDDFNQMHLENIR